MNDEVTVLSASESRESPLFEAVGCVCIYDRQILLLKCTKDRSYPETWGLPSGKVESQETRDRAVIRELFEETGLLRSAANLDYLRDFHVINNDFTFLYALFSTKFTALPVVKLNSIEHDECRWFTIGDAIKLTLVPGTRECLETVERKLFPPTQLSLFSLDDHLLADAVHAEQEQLENSIGKHFIWPATRATHSPIVVIASPSWSMPPRCSASRSTAGTPGVVGSLWPVADRSTAMLMAQFYRYHLHGDPTTGERPMTPARA